MKLNLWTTMWGRKLEAYLDIMLPSLLQPGNLLAIADHVNYYTFYTDEATRQALEEHVLFNVLAEMVKVRWFPLQKGLWEVNSNTLHQMRLSAEEKCYMAVCSPDDVVGNGSLQGLIACISKGYNPILYPLPRLRESVYSVAQKRLAHGLLSNRELVSLTLKHLHWPNNGYLIIPDGEGNYQAWHPTPTPVICPDARLINLFEGNYGKNWGYDNCLPMIMIDLQYPWLLIPDSDLYWQVEIGTTGKEPGGQPMNSPCCTWEMAKATRLVNYFSPHRAESTSQRYTLWRPEAKKRRTECKTRSELTVTS